MTVEFAPRMGASPLPVVAAAIRLPVAVLEKARSRIQVKMDGEDRATVSFPEACGGLVLGVGRVGDRWRLVGLPMRP